MSEVGPWDVVAEGYSEVTVGLFRTYSETALDLASLKPQHRIADIGCGPGTLALAAADKVAGITAVDFSEGMIRVLNRTLNETGIKNVETHVADGQALPFPDASFDAAFSMFGLMFFPDRHKGYGELYRTLKPGGFCCVSSWLPISKSPLIEVMFKAIQAINPNVPDPVYDVDSLENPDVLSAELAQAGFRSIDVRQVTGTAEFPSAEAYWTAMSKGAAPIAVMKRGLSPAEWGEKSKVAIGTVEETAGPFPTTLSATAWLGTARKKGLAPTPAPPARR